MEKFDGDHATHGHVDGEPSEKEDPSSRLPNDEHGVDDGVNDTTSGVRTEKHFGQKFVRIRQNE